MNKTIDDLKRRVKAGELAPVDAIDLAFATAKGEALGAKGMAIVQKYVEAVCNHFNVTREALSGANRTQQVVSARKTLVFLARKKGAKELQIAPVVSPTATRGTVSKLWSMALNEVNNGEGISFAVKLLS